MRPAAFSSLIHKRLRTKTDAIETSRSPFRCFFGLDGFRVGFERDFSKCTGEIIAKRLKYLGEELRFEEAGSASADVDGINNWLRGATKIRKRDASRIEQAHVVADLTAYGFGIRREAAWRDHAGMEVAVGALRLAERNLNVYAEIRHV